MLSKSNNFHESFLLAKIQIQINAYRINDKRIIMFPT